MVKMLDLYCTIYWYKNLFRNFTEYKWGMEAFMIAHDRMVNGEKRPADRHIEGKDQRGQATG